MELSDQQGKAVKNVVNWFKNEEFLEKQSHELAGFAGTGKSTILPYIIDDLGLTTSEVAFAAPTGKAAKVMATKLLGQGYAGADTRTVHSLIYQPKMQKVEVLEREIQELKALCLALKNGEAPDHIAGPDPRAKIKEVEKQIEINEKDLDRAYDIDKPRFHLNPESVLVTGAKKLIVIDEGSMVGKEMAEDLLSFDIPILVMGDPGQLPPVDSDMGFDLENPDTFLTEIHRQAADNPIIRLATLIRQGDRPDYGDYGQGVKVVTPRQDVYTYDLDREAQIICGRNKTRWKMTSKLRREGGFSGLAPHNGEPLIMCKNSKVHPALVNGTPIFSGIDHDDLHDGAARFLMTAYDEDGRKYEMFVYQGLFEEHLKQEKGFCTADKQSAWRARVKDNHVDFGWVITCHKSQGSQWDEVVVHDESSAFREDCDKWLYTAVTRAAERLIIVAS
jgi:exodeoxyribonuclease-5